jgi:hypothetical protein
VAPPFRLGRAGNLGVGRSQGRNCCVENGTTRRERAENGGLFMKRDYRKDQDILIELGGG